ncbi:predicted protein, partial [Nematostella vectensis]
DVNECYQDNGKCEQGCINTYGSFHCGCWRGYKVNPSNASKCLEHPQCKAMCINTIGSYKCACHPGFRLTSQNECIDVDECQNNNGGCEQNCVNIPGSYRCNCNLGFTLHFNGRNCT